MEWIEVVSTNIKAVAYDAVLSKLHVKFNSGAEYVYLDVPVEVFNGLVEAPSTGRFFADEIRGKYEYYREEDDTQEASAV